MSINEWKQLTSYSHCRQRCEVYFGSRDPVTQNVLEYSETGPRIVEVTWVPALFTAFRELVDNCLDEVVWHKRGDTMTIDFDADQLIFKVTDNGKGIPIEWSDAHQKYAATVLLSEMNSGRNFIEDRGQTRGLNGIGAKGVNFCSEWFRVDVSRDKKHFKQNFHEGDELIVDPPAITPITSRKTGTAIECKLSPRVFADMRLPERFIAARMHEIAFCYPDLKLIYNGAQIKPKALFGDHRTIDFAIEEPSLKAKFWLIPEFTKDSEFVYSIVNGIPLFNGGAHIDAFRKGFYSGLLTGLERESKRRKLTPNRADISDGMFVYCMLEMAEPSFDSQSKSRLINEPVGAQVRKLLDDPKFFTNVIKNNPEWIESIYWRCAERTQVKDNRDAKKQAKKNLRQKIENLEDACAFDRSRCVLFLAEGNSAIAGIVEARDPEIHGGLPLRGKVLNVYGRPTKEILANEALAKIMNSVGLIPGERVNRHSLRYGKIYLTCDADPDGANIASLLVNFFYSCWPELFDPNKPPFIHVFDTPLIIAVKGKQRRYWYSANYSQFDADRYKGWEITRAKGLAALQRDDWRYVLEHPQVIPIVDDGDLKPTLKLLFDPTQADARKDWIGI
jgi:DNA gyrase/topoisomerase IV subunit B